MHDIYNKANLFICIGQMRAGSTWLYEALLQNSCGFVPPVKELSYFSRMELATERSFQERVAFGKHRAFGLDNLYLAHDKIHLEAFSDMIRNLSENMSPGDIRSIDWYWSYLRDDLSFATYSKLMDMSYPNPLIDISPEYFQLAANTVSQIKSNFPNSKAIVIKRDAFERFLSMIGRSPRLHAKMSSMTIDGWQHFIENRVTDQELDHVLNHLRTCAHIDKWRKVYNSDLLECYFQDLKDNPENFLLEIMEFAGFKIPTTLSLPGRVNENTLKKVRLDATLERAIRELLSGPHYQIGQP